MKKRTFIMCWVATCLAFLFVFSGCESDMGETSTVGDTSAVCETTDIEEESTETIEDGVRTAGRLYFGKDKSRALLIDDYGILIWLYPVKSGMFDSYDTGDTVTVVHGPVMLSLPGQTNVSYVSLISNGDESVFTEEELAEIMKVIDGFR